MYCRGKVVIIVNVASQCGLTNSNYTQLKVTRTDDIGRSFLVFHEWK